jgi:hypothetical protein
MPAHANRTFPAICLSFGILALVGRCAGTQNPGSRYRILQIPVGKGAASVEIADFNRDRFPDIAVANTGDSSVTILLNTGRGEFREAKGSPFYAGAFPNDICIADFNKDGIPDLAFANHEKKYLTVLLGNGDGGFHPDPHSPFAVAVKPHTHGVIAADFNGDGNMDLGTESWGVDSILILWGDGKGGFGNPRFYSVGKHPYQRLRTADLNQDGFPDIVTTNLDGGTVTILMGDGKGGFGRSFFEAGATPFGLGVGDFNHDGHEDLAIVNAPSITSDNIGKDGLTVLLGDGKGKFTSMPGSPFRTGGGPSRVATGDLNQDGVDDIVVTNYTSATLSIFYMSPKGLISSETLPVGKHPEGVAIRDMNGDGKNDIVASSSDENRITVFFHK